MVARREALERSSAV